MADTFVKIATVTVGAGGSTTISFSSIPQSYTDLVIKLSLRSSTTNTDPKMEFNGVTTGYSRRSLYGTGTIAASASASDAWIGTITGTNETANTFSNSEIYIPNYTSANNKSYSIDSVQETNATPVNQVLNANLWSNTAAITSFILSGLSSTLTFVEYSKVTLYGIKKS
jgi:hypothetical protein